MSFTAKVWSGTLVLSIILILASRSVGFAQVTAAMTGRVDDSTGAGIPATSVTVTSLETGATRTVTTDDTGAYQILSLPVGRYNIKAAKTKLIMPSVTMIAPASIAATLALSTILKRSSA